jgi:hypothetical protein
VKDLDVLSTSHCWLNESGDSSLDCFSH